MSADLKDRERVLKLLSHIRIQLIAKVLSSAVDKEAEIDKKLKQNFEEQRELKNFIRGLIIIYYFSFLQSNLVETQWEQIIQN